MRISPATCWAWRSSSSASGCTIAGDGRVGWPEGAPFDAILVTAAAPALVAALIGQLGEGGRLIAPVGGATAQSLVELRKGADGSIEETVLAPVSFVPLLSGVLD